MSDKERVQLLYHRNKVTIQYYVVDLKKKKKINYESYRGSLVKLSERYPVSRQNLMRY